MDPFSHPLHLQQIQHPTTVFPQQRETKTVEEDTNSARKTQKADREKLRRDRLNEQFLELGTALYPDRPKNDKARILADAVEILKELAAEVSRLKAEHASLSEESSDLIQEKNELRDEKATLKSDVDSLNVQYHERMQLMFPWPTLDPMVPMQPTLMPDSHPTAATITQGHFQTPLGSPLGSPLMPFPMHPFPFFRAPDGTNAYFPYPPYAPHVTSMPHIERPSAQYPLMQPLPGYLMQLQSPPNPVPVSVTYSTSARESTQKGSGTMEVQNVNNPIKRSCSSSRSRSGRSKCKNQGRDINAGTRVTHDLLSSDSSSSEGEVQDMLQPKEHLMETKTLEPKTDSTPTSENVNSNGSAIQHPKDGSNSGNADNEHSNTLLVIN